MSVPFPALTPPHHFPSKTFNGGYKAFNRVGIATLPSPLLRATYESSAIFISDASLHGDFDTLTTPSGAIVMGRPIPCGTGTFDVLADLSAATAK